MDHLKEILRASDNRLTSPRKQIFVALKQAEKPLSLRQLREQCPDIDRTSIYRTLQLYISLHIVDVIHMGWKKRYELSDPFKPHHHHLQCIGCRQLVTINTPDLEQLVDHLAKQHGYQLTQHHFELQGYCPSCQSDHQKTNRAANSGAT